MINVVIREEIFEPIRVEAEQEKTSVESLVNEWLGRQLALVREQKIREESARFRAKHAQLRARYSGEYVAMRNGEVLDHDPEARELYLRIQQRFGEQPVLIAPVSDQPTATFNVRSLFLDGPKQLSGILDEATLQQLHARRETS
jgi:hypothetical protein